MKVNCPECKRRVRIRKNVRLNRCKCGYLFQHDHWFERENDVYLVDANVFIYALNNDEYRGKHCNAVLTGPYQIATTKRVIREVKQYNHYRVRYYEVKEICEDVDELCYNSLKELSDADKSLIQCAINNPEISGIITNDIDVKSVCPERLIMSQRKFFIGRPNEFLKWKGDL